MGRRRKVPVANGKSVDAAEENLKKSARISTIIKDRIYAIMSRVQLNETCHNKYLKELKQLYNEMEHDDFIYAFIMMIKTAMVAEETNDFAHTSLVFCAKFITGFDGDDTHPLLADVFRWLLTTISNNPHIRLRLCQFVNIILSALGTEATLDDVICDSIMEYMVNRLVDVSPSVRVQAVLAMQRLQVPDNPDDPVLRSYQYHLCSDPSPRVRQTVITCMGRNYHTIPYILDRLWDIDEKVRRHTYLHMSSYPVRSYKVSQRLTLLEQGLNDRSELVRKVVTLVMLHQWVESYQKDLVALIGALKLDSNAVDIERFRKTAKQALKEIFRRYSKSDLIACVHVDNESEHYRCIPLEKLTLEMALYWQCLTEYLQTEDAEELDQVLPELSTFCAYVENYCKQQKADMDTFETIEFQYILLCLMEILHNFDLGDEIGRNNLKQLLEHLLKNVNVNERIIEVIVRCSENLITDQNIRYQFFLDIIQDMCGLRRKQNDLVHDRNLITELLANSGDADLNLKLSSLKVKILDLEEQEINFLQQKDCARIQEIVEEKNAATEEFTKLLQPLLEKHNQASGDALQPQFSNVVRQECILKSLQIIFHMIVSKSVKSLKPTTSRLYNDFIFRYMASNQICLREWALKCGAALSMHYEPLAKEVFNELYAQFFRNHNIRIWETAITCIFELIDRYGPNNFTTIEREHKAKKTTMRQLYNTLEFIDADEDEQQNNTSLDQGVGVVYIMSHFLDTCDDSCIVRCIVNGFCRLILHGHIDNRDIMEKLLLRYFDPSTEPEINQILGIFLQNLIEQKKHKILHECLMATINSVLSAPYDSALHDIRPETITRFIIDATRPNLADKGIDSTHNKLASAFLQEMLTNTNNKEFCKLLAKELLTLEINLTQKDDLKKELKQLAEKVIQKKFDPPTTKKIIDFTRIIDGTFKPLPNGIAEENESDEEGDEDEHLNGRDTNFETDPVSLATEHEPSLNNQSVNVSPPLVATPTTFGSENSTTHRSLRKSLNISRNNSIEVQNESICNSPLQTRKIRIEARIDSDKKATSSLTGQELSKVRVVTRSQVNKVKNQTVNSKNVRQPDEVAKTITAEKSNKTTASTPSMETIREKSLEENSSQDTRKATDKETTKDKQRKDTKTGSKLASRNSLEKNNLDVIPPSPEKSTSVNMLHRRTRSHTRLDHRSTTLDSTNIDTPVRNGRKRVLRSRSKVKTRSDSVELPVRKQKCSTLEANNKSKSLPDVTGGTVNKKKEPKHRRRRHFKLNN